MHERKAVMAELSVASIALPGGLGTLEELSRCDLEQLGLHQKPSRRPGCAGLLPNPLNRIPWTMR